MLISETRDKGSEGKLRYTLQAAEINNVQVYTVNMSRFVNTLLAKTPLPRPPAVPAGLQTGDQFARRHRSCEGPYPMFG